MNAEGPNRVDLNQRVFLNDWPAIYSTAVMSVVHLRDCIGAGTPYM